MVFLFEIWNYIPLKHLLTKLLYEIDTAYGTKQCIDNISHMHISHANEWNGDTFSFVICLVSFSCIWPNVKNDYMLIYIVVFHTIPYTVSITTNVFVFDCDAISNSHLHLLAPRSQIRSFKCHIFNCSPLIFKVIVFN